MTSLLATISESPRTGTGTPGHTDLLGHLAIVFDAHTTIALALIATITAGVASVWVFTLVRVRALRRSGAESLTGRVQCAAGLNGTAVLVTLAGLVVVMLVAVWRLVVALI
ncbi:hypothetical protein [Pseudoclavibacter terrae]|uniref:Uncharacterized protein n=1 Tax=Pseudoclavibacter terrae TaxID=1530195 RepID=A0A7J5AX67_9MICO|nr:hypothetical protein [Pseudoclavibacter terrae]KAB1636056.1 hypothetical protein F8O03_17490 [Pseudoclavibacter terrae]